MRGVLVRYAAFAVLFLRNNIVASPVVNSGNFSIYSNQTSAAPTITAAASTIEPTATSTCTITYNPFLENIDANNYYVSCNGNPATYVPAYNVWEYATWDRGMASRCSASYESALDEYLTTAPALVFTETMSNNDVPVKTTTYSIQTGDPFNFMPTQGSECCLNCTLYGESVEAYYWPTSVPPSNPFPNATITSAPASPSIISMLVNGDNFTYTSPSIYVVFHSLSADNYCGQVGPVVENATLAFDPGELKTARDWTWSGGGEYSDEPPYVPDDFQVGDWNSQPTCGDVTSFFYQNALDTLIWTDPAAAPTSCKTDVCWIQSYTITWDPCKPKISVPPQVFGVNSAWSSCQKGIGAMKDPPYILTTGPSLTPLTVTAPGGAASPTPHPISVAQPGSTVTSTGAARTTPYSTGPTPFPDSPGHNSPPNNYPPSDPSPADPSGNGPPSKDPPSKDPPNDNSPGQAGNTSPQSNNPDHSSTGGNFLPLPTTPAPIDYIIGSQTLAPNGPAVTVSGTTYSLLPSNSIVINGETRSFIQGGASSYIVGSQWLIAGSSAITVNGTRVSLMPGGSSVVVGGTTEAIGGFIAPVETGTATEKGTQVESISLDGYVKPTKVSTKARIATGSAGLATPTGSSAKRVTSWMGPMVAIAIMILGIIGV